MDQTEVTISKGSAKRLMKDIRDVITKPLDGEGIYYKHDTEDMLKGYAMIVGPSYGLYANGIYFFIFHFPTDYPYTPPRVEYCTNDGTTRFNPNLYRQGKVCLSILNTWTGDSWTACQTIRSVLLQLLLLFNDKPKKDLLGSLDIKLVFTAHPTEAARPEILNQINILHQIIKARHDERLGGTPFSKLSFQSELKESAKIIIQTDELRQLKPTPIDEAINNLFYIDKVVYEEIPKLNLFLKDILDSDHIDDSFSPITIGTWIGGDRDGNPNVNHKLTTEIIEIQYNRNKERIINEIKELIENLSQSVHIVTFSKKLSGFINSDQSARFISNLKKYCWR